MFQESSGSGQLELQFMGRVRHTVICPPFTRLKTTETGRQNPHPLIALRTDTIYSTTDSDKQPTSNLKGFLMNHFLLLEMQE